RSRLAGGGAAARQAPGGDSGHTGATRHAQDVANLPTRGRPPRQPHEGDEGLSGRGLRTFAKRLNPASIGCDQRTAPSLRLRGIMPVDFDTLLANAEVTERLSWTFDYRIE